MWNPTGQPATKAESALGPEQRSHLQRIESHAFAEVIDIVFASARRSLEALCIALATTDRLSFAAPSPLVQETADGVIQVLGSRRSRLSTHDANALQNIPRYVVAYIHAVARKNGVAPQTLERQVMDYLATVRRAFAWRSPACFLPTRFALSVPGSSSSHVRSAAGSICIAAGNVCVECLANLDPPQLLAAAISTNDYYNFLATQAGELFRLNCEELTGQTDKADARNRQRLFQGVCLPRPTEEPRTDEVDLLSVTTTMEAGVDIGSLLCGDDGQYAAYAIQLSAADRPRGRRGAGLAAALTLCRGRSHDDYYFQRPNRITSDPPPQPYVDSAPWRDSSAGIEQGSATAGVCRIGTVRR